MSQDDEAFIQWAGQRYRWVWRWAGGVDRGRGAFKSRRLRNMAAEFAGALMRLDRLAWRSGLVRGRGR